MKASPPTRRAGAVHRGAAPLAWSVQWSRWRGRLATFGDRGWWATGRERRGGGATGAVGGPCSHHSPSAGPGSRRARAVGVVPRRPGPRADAATCRWCLVASAPLVLSGFRRDTQPHGPPRPQCQVAAGGWEPRPPPPRAAAFFGGAWAALLSVWMNARGCGVSCF